MNRVPSGCAERGGQSAGPVCLLLHSPGPASTQTRISQALAQGPAHSILGRRNAGQGLREAGASSQKTGWALGRAREVPEDP